HPAELLVRIGDQVEREAVLRLELLVRSDAVAGHAEHGDAEPLELAVQVAEPLALQRAARRVVLRVEVQHVRRAEQLLARHGAPAGRGGREGGDLLADFGRRHRARYACFTGSMIASTFSWSQKSMNSSRSPEMCTFAGMLMYICTENIGAPVWAAA